MNKQNAIIISVFLISAVFKTGFSLGEKTGFPPMKAGVLSIEDNEQLRYGTYVSGEKRDDTYYYLKIDSGKNILRMYVQTIKIDSKEMPPDNYSNYRGVYEIDLEKASISSIHFSNPEARLKKTADFLDVKLNTDFTSHQVTVHIKMWDGTLEKDSFSRIAFKPGYPVWDSDSLVLISPRFLDFDSGGIVYGLYPNLVKDPIPGSTRFIKKETVTTEAGTFNTVKYGFVIADPFLSKLLQPYVKNFFIWQEDSPRRLIVKIHFGDINTDVLLEDVSCSGGNIKS